MRESIDSDTPLNSLLGACYACEPALRACRMRFACGLSLSHPDPGMEFLNSALIPQTLQVPTLVGPLGLSIIQ